MLSIITYKDRVKFVSYKISNLKWRKWWKLMLIDTCIVYSGSGWSRKLLVAIYAYSSTLLADRHWGLILSVSQRHLSIVSQTGPYSMFTCTFRPKKNESTSGPNFKSRNPRTFWSVQELNCRAVHMPEQFCMRRLIF